MSSRKSLQDQVSKILQNAQSKGVSQNYFFTTTFKRYQFQMSILQQLENQIAEEGTLCEKQYVKGRKNLYTNPAVTEYNRTATAANQTVCTLIKIVQGFSDDAGAQESKLGKFLANLG